MCVTRAIGVLGSVNRRDGASPSLTPYMGLVPFFTL